MISFEQVCFHEWCNASFMETKDPCVSVCYAQYGAMLFCINSMNVIGYKSIYHREITKIVIFVKNVFTFRFSHVKGCLIYSIRCKLNLIEYECSCKISLYDSFPRIRISIDHRRIVLYWILVMNIYSYICFKSLFM